MKKIIGLLLFFTLISELAFSQQNYQDVVYLKNGSIIHGVIIEQIPNKSIKIQTSDRNVFVYQMEEIEKITREVPESITKMNIQIQKRRGYIGLSIGPSIPVGEFADISNGVAKTGIQLNLVNFGYLFSENFGIAAKWFGAANPVDAEGIDPWSYGGLMTGPLLSFQVADKVEWDFHPMIGYCVAMLPDLGTGYVSEYDGSFAYNIGAAFRFNVGNKVALLVGADYFSTKSVFQDNHIEQKIGTLSFDFGVAFRLR